jgi:hypothetical protein
MNSAITMERHQADVPEQATPHFAVDDRRTLNLAEG